MFQPQPDQNTAVDIHPVEQGYSKWPCAQPGTVIYTIWMARAWRLSAAAILQSQTGIVSWGQLPVVGNLCHYSLEGSNTSATGARSWTQWYVPNEGHRPELHMVVWHGSGYWGHVEDLCGISVSEEYACSSSFAFLGVTSQAMVTNPHWLCWTISRVHVLVGGECTL